jgi:AAA domain-containing protein
VTPAQTEQLETLARELYAGHPAALPLLTVSIHGETDEEKARAAAALTAIDPLVPVPDVVSRAVRRSERSVQHLRAVPRPIGSGPAPDPDAPDAEREPAGFVAALELAKAPPTRWIVEHVVPAGGVTVLVGESGAGKTFIALGLAADIGAGREWFGLATQRGSVAYVFMEGDAIGLRVQALHEHGASLEDLFVLRASDPISPRVLRDGLEAPSIGEARITEDLARLAADLGRWGRPPLVALVIDTVRASMTGSEDNSEDVSAYLRAVRRILATIPGAACILVHHAGWQDGETKRKRERGSSAFRGNADGTLYVEVDEEERTDGSAALVIRTLKTRDAERPAPIRVIRQRVNVLGFDARGNPLTSCVIVRDPRTRMDREAAVAAVIASAERELDVRVLRVIRDCPTATSRALIRERVKAGKVAVFDSVARLLDGNLITEGKRGEPFVLTPAGEHLAGGAES